MALTLRSVQGVVKNKILFIRPIMTTSLKFEKVMEKLQKNPFYDKYADRIASLQKKSPEKFLQTAEPLKDEQQSKGSEEKKFAPIDTRQYSYVLNPKEALKNNIIPEDSKLNEILKIDLVKDKTASEIQTIWEEYHKNKEVISAIIPVNVYDIISKNMKEFSTFLFPLPREQGFEFMMCQNFGNTVHFTPLLAFQIHKENAPECLKMVHYTELSNKGIVLMRGEFDKNVLNGKEAQCLANQFQMYYNGKDEAKKKVLEKFTKQPDSFKHTDLISQLEKIGLPS